MKGEPGADQAPPVLFAIRTFTPFGTFWLNHTFKKPDQWQRRASGSTCWRERQHAEQALRLLNAEQPSLFARREVVAMLNRTAAPRKPGR